MDEEKDQLPLARMMSISKPSFWIYFTVCAVLFAYSILASRAPVADWRIPSLIALCIFTALLLELASQHIKSEKAANLLTNGCYIFEALSVIALLFIIINK